MVGYGELEAEQLEDGADQALGLAQRQAEHRPARSVRAVSIAKAESCGCPPRVVRGSAAQAATASSVNHTVRPNLNS